MTIAEFDPEGLIKSLAWHAYQRTGAIDLSSGQRSADSIPLVYIDTNPWGRHLDDQSIQRNEDEAKAFSEILHRLSRGLLRLAYSSVSFGDGVRLDGGLTASRAALRAIVNLGVLGTPLIAHAQRRSRVPP